MASFSFDNNSEDLDLNIGGDQAARKKAPAPAPEASGQQNRAARPTGVKANDLLRNRPATRPATPAQRPAATQAPNTPTVPTQQPQQASKPAQQAAASRPAQTASRPAQAAPRPQTPATRVAAVAPIVAPETSFPSSAEPVANVARVAADPAPIPPSSTLLSPSSLLDEEAGSGFRPLTPEPTAPIYRAPRVQAPEPELDEDLYYDEPEEVVPQRQPRVGTSVPRNSQRNPRQPEVRQQEDKKPGPLMAFFGPFIGKGTNQKTSDKKESKKPKQSNDNYAGNRNKVLLIRVVGGFVIGIVLLSGARALFFPSKGPTKAAVAAVAQESVGYTGFPSSMGDGVALSFTQVFLTYSTQDDSDLRKAQLEQFTTAALSDLMSISNKSVSPTDANSTEIKVIKQSIVVGPYVVTSKNVDATHAIVTTAAKLDDNSWVYLSIPLVYDKVTNNVTVNGVPTFVPAVKAAKTVDSSAYDVSWSSDDALSNSYKPSLALYLEAWANSDSTALSPYLAAKSGSDDGASLEARQGLGGSVSLEKTDDLTDLNVEAVDPSVGDVNVRRMQFTVNWTAPNGLIYPQVYRGTIQYSTDTKRWLIKDIKNASLVSGVGVDE